MGTRRDFLTTLGAGAAGAALLPAASDSPVFSAFSATVSAAAASAPGALRFACHTMTWGGDYVTGIADIGEAGFQGVQLRANVLPQFAEKPDALKALLAANRVEFVCFSSNNVAIAPEKEAESLALHEKNARFVAAAGGQFLQVTDERPKDRQPTADDRKRMGGLLTTLGQRTQALGVKLVYHNHMGNLGERPEEVAEVLAASDPAVVGFLLDIAHYTQAGGDVAAAIRTHKARLALVHAKDVRTRPRAADAPANASSYQFVELGRGRADLPGAFAAIAEVGYRGWVIVELDAIPDAGGSASASMLTSKRYIEQVLKLAL
jgi:inosose dehydratase